MTGPRRFGTLVAAALAGASGLALQVQLATCAALPLGHGAGPALALAVFLASWALGAWAAGRFLTRAGPALLASGLALALSAIPAILLALDGGAIPALLAVGGIAALQGVFLPLLARVAGARGSAAVWPLVTANLLGAWAGAGWIADGIVGASGRVDAAFVAGACALLAGAFGWWAERGARQLEGRATVEAAGVVAALGPFAAALVIGLCTAWMSALEWTLVRLGALWFGGMQDALTAVLTASLAALALGAALLPPLLPRGVRGVAAGLALCALGSLWPLGLDRALGAATGQPLAVRALVLCLPALLPFGALVPLVHRARGGEVGESGRVLGDVYLHEAWGALLGIPLVQLALVPRIGLAGGLGVLAASGTAAALALLPRARVAGALAATLSAAAALLLLRAEPPALRSPPLTNPALVVRSFAEDRDFAVSVVDDGLLGERTLLTDGFRAAGTGRDYRYMRVLGHLPLLLHPAPRRVAVLALGTGTTVGAVSLHPEVARIDVLEISRAVVAAAPLFSEHNRAALSEGLPGLLDPDDGAGRVVVRLGDGRTTLRGSPATYDVVTMEPLLPDSPFGVYLYTEEFYAEVKRALRPGGLVCQWVPPHALRPETFDAVLEAFGRSFRWSGVWLAGTQVILVGAERYPELPERPAERVTPEGAAELARLGLATRSSIAVQCVAALGYDDSARGRVLRDRDPWIAYRPAASGAAVLAFLPQNLARFVGEGSRWPLIPFGYEDSAAMRAARATRAARLAWARAEAALRGALPQDGSDVDVALAEAAAQGGGAEYEALAEEIRFVRDLRTGVGLLARDRSADGARAALDPLTRAAQARPERADVHAYVAAALQRIGSAAAGKALDAALERCPRLAETDPGRRARDLGLSEAQWRRATLTAIAATATRVE